VSSVKPGGQSRDRAPGRACRPKRSLCFSTVSGAVRVGEPTGSSSRDTDGRRRRSARHRRSLKIEQTGRGGRTPTSPGALRGLGLCGLAGRSLCDRVGPGPRSRWRIPDRSAIGPVGGWRRRGADRRPPIVGQRSLADRFDWWMAGRADASHDRGMSSNRGEAATGPDDYDQRRRH